MRGVGEGRVSACERNTQQDTRGTGGPGDKTRAHAAITNKRTDNAPLLDAHNLLAFKPSNDSVSGRFEVNELDLGLVAARSHDGSLITHVGDVSAHKAWGEGGETGRVRLER